MQKQNIELDLVPFTPASTLDPNLKIRVAIKKINSPNPLKEPLILTLRFQIIGDLSQILLPKPEKISGQRKNNLWKHTCFEAFLAPSDTTQYWEFNASPSGDWNFYRFQSYRTGQEIEPRLSQPQISFQENGDQSFAGQIQIPLSDIEELKNSPTLSIGISVVLESIQGEISYWALRHCGSQPDFHLRESFILNHLWK